MGKGTWEKQMTLKALIEDLELNHEHCPKEVILKAAAELRRLHAEVKTLKRAVFALETKLGVRGYEIQIADLVAEVEALRADAERLDWCIDILFYSRPGDSYLVTDAGCGCCGDGKSFNEEISGRNAIDAARGEK